MAFKHGRLAEITVATKALSTFCDTADINIKVDTADTSTFTAAWKTAISGLAGATLTLSGGYDPTVTTGPASVLTSQIALNQDRKSTRLNSSHVAISYAVFCLKKKNRQPSAHVAIGKPRAHT